MLIVLCLPRTESEWSICDRRTNVGSSAKSSMISKSEKHVYNSSSSCRQLFDAEYPKENLSALAASVSTLICSVESKFI